jgi:integrase
MARMPRVPKPEPRKNDILAVQIRVPAELQTFVGKKVLRRSTGTKDDRVYYQRAPAIVLEFEVVLQAARQHLEQRPVRKFVEIIQPLQTLFRMIPDLPLVEFGDGRMGMWQWVRPEDASDPQAWPTPIKPVADGAATVKVADGAATMKVAGCSTATVMALWRVKRGDNQPKQRAIDSRESKMAKFLAWARKPDDLTLISKADLQTYKEHLIAVYPPPSNVCRDHLTDILALFRVGDENHKFDGVPGGNPAEKIKLPPKRRGLSRLAFTEPEAKKILLAAREHPEPIVRWGMFLDCYLGTITEEVADGLVKHVKLVDGIWCFDITTSGRTTIVEGKKVIANLKTQFRDRLLPLHPAVICEGFLDRVEDVRRRHGENAPLFPEIAPDKFGQRNGKASNITMAFLRDIGIENEIDPDTGRVTALRDTYGWRHRFASRLQDTSHIEGSTPERRRFMTGHAAPDVHEKVYLQHPPEKTKPIINALPDPLTRRQR